MLDMKDDGLQSPLTGRSIELLQATNDAAAFFQRSAHSETAVFHAYQEQMAALKLRGGLSFLNDSGDTLTVRVVNYSGRIGQILRRLEKLVGLRTENFSFDINHVDVYRTVIETKQTQFIPDSSVVIVQMLPLRLAPYLNRIITSFGMHPGIYAPLIGPDGRVRGVLNMVDPHLTAQDVPALTAFANQIAVALDNARLFEEIRRYADELEQRVVVRTQELAAANERLTELDQLKSQLISNVSHELRTPITTLELYLDLLKHGNAEKRDHYLKIIEAQSHRLKYLVEDILDLSRLEAGQGKFQFGPVQLNDVVAQIMTMQQARAEAKGLALRFVPDERLPAIEGIRSQLVQVVTNLIINSINYTQLGHIQVIVRLDGDDGRINLSVSDTGSGIHPEDIPHIFDRFYRGRENKQGHIPGTGLGLAIVKEIVGIHSGEILVDSEVGRGTTVQILLPVAQRR